MTTVFLNTGASSFPNPGNWNPVNKIECLGSGGAGAGTYSPPLAEGEPAPQAGPGNPGSGGGGGAYAYADNIVATFPVPVSIGAKNLLGTGIIDVTGTWWKSTNTTLPDVVAAANGTTNNQSGLSFGGYQFHPQGFKGGDGAVSSGFSGTGNGSGGGGAAGPKGVGTNGVTPSTAGGLGSGGAGNGNTISGGMAIGVGGANDSQWPPYGCGGGGAGGSGTVVTNGGPGGVYGAGGGGAGGSGSTVGGSGQDGLMIITYVPIAPPPPSVRVMVMA